MRNYGEVPPVLSTASAPAVSATTGLGTGGGAGVQSKGSPSDGQGFGSVEIVTGSNPSVGGSVTLVFATAPPVLFFGSSDAFGTLTVPNNDGTHTTLVVSWTAQLPPGRRLAIHYEWAVSR